MFTNSLPSVLVRRVELVEYSNTQELLTTPIMTISAMAVETVTSIRQWSMICIMVDKPRSRQAGLRPMTTSCKAHVNFSQQRSATVLRYNFNSLLLLRGIYLRLRFVSDGGTAHKVRSLHVPSPSLVLSPPGWMM